MSSNGWENELLKTATLFGRVLEPEETEIWENLLKPYPPAALAYAFDNWRRNGNFWCKPFNIIQLIDVYRGTQRSSKLPTYEHQGEGYNEGDMLSLWKMVSAKSIKLKRYLVQDEIWELLGEIDKKRPGGAPAFRRAVPRQLMP
jgi:hypothetical protein